MENGRLNRDLWAVVISFVAVLILVSLLTADVRDRSFNTPSGLVSTYNWGGFVGAYLADMLLQGLGLTAYFLPFFFGLAAYKLFQPSFKGIRAARIAGYFALLVSAAVLISIIVDSENARDAGGIIGGFLKETMLVPWFGRISATLITLLALLLSIMLLTRYSLFDLWQRARKRSTELKKSLTPVINQQLQELRERGEKRRGENVRKERSEYTPPPIVVKEDAKAEAAKRNPKKPAALQEQFKLPEMSEGYKLPTPNLLDVPENQPLKLDRETLHANSLILQKKLADFGVEGEVTAVRPGPVITMYEFKPAPGVKVRRIVMLADDLAMALRAVSVRILAPIPGESVVGIEIPNPRRETVFLREVIESEAYQNADSNLTFALGKDIGGTPFVTDLARMPHLLVAGATGTGKSVAINAMILSILFKSTPRDVQFIMVDPKMLELTVYEDIPHLLVPVVTDPKKAAAALFWAMDEMDRRYRLMRDKGARSLDNYNRTVEKEMVMRPARTLKEAEPGEEAS
jgi:S-DNA-T family DNA segregation ATPase FtsK/SpoIIIE